MTATINEKVGSPAGNTGDETLLAAREDWRNSILELDSRQALIENVMRAYTHSQDVASQPAKVAQLRAQLVNMHCQERLLANTRYVEAMIDALPRLPSVGRRAFNTRERRVRLQALQQRFAAVSQALLDEGTRLKLAAHWRLNGSHAKASELQHEMTALNAQLLQFDRAFGGLWNKPQGH